MSPSNIQRRRVEALVLARAHALEADRLTSSHYRLGVPVVIITTIVGTTGFATLTDLGNTRIWIAIGTGLLSVTAAVLAAIQTFLSFGGRAEKHAVAAAVFRSFPAQLDFIKEDEEAKLTEFDQKFSTAVAEHPRVSQDVQDKAKRLVNADFRTRTGGVSVSNFKIH